MWNAIILHSRWGGFIRERGLAVMSVFGNIVFSLSWFGAMPPTNLAERQLRPAVTARKISCGNKIKKGARTWQILASLAATCAQRTVSFIETLARAAPLKGR